MDKVKEVFKSLKESRQIYEGLTFLKIYAIILKKDLPQPVLRV